MPDLTLYQRVQQAQGVKNPDGSRAYSDQQIWDTLQGSPDFKRATDAGGSPEDIQSLLGLSGIAAPAPTPQDTSLARYPKMLGGALVEGAGSVLGMPGTGLRLLNQLVPDEWKWSPNSPLWMIPDANTIHGWTRAAGLTDRPEAQPQNIPEQYAKGAAEGIGAGLPLAIFGGVGSIPEFAAAGAASGAGETTANLLFPGNPWAGLIGSVMGSIGGQGLVRTAGKALAQSDAARALESISGQLKGFDLETSLQAQAKRAARDQTMADADAQFAANGNLAQAAAAAAKAGPMGEIAAQTARLSPTAMGWQDAGEALQASARNWMDALPKKLESTWEPIDSGIPDNLPLSLDNFESTLQGMNKSGGTLQPLIDALTPRLSKQLGSTLDSIRGAQQIGTTGAFTWGGARQLRTAIGEALSNPGALADIGTQRLKALYGALTEDLRGAATAEGLGDEFNSANAASSQLFQTAEGPIAKVLSSRLPGEIAKSLYGQGSTDATLLSALRDELPDGMDALAAASLREGQGNWLKLSPASREALVPDAASRNALDSATTALADADTVAGINQKAALGARVAAKKQASQDFADWQTARQQEKLRLQMSLSDAQEQAREAGLGAGGGQSAVAQGVNSLVRLVGGGTLGGTALDLLGFSPDTFTNSKIAAGIALGLPILAHGASELWQHPDLAAGPLIGVANQLDPTSRLQQKRVQGGGLD